VSVLSRLLDATIVLSFDRSGFRRHAASFRPEDLQVDLSGRVAVVTGANSGIGKATSRALAERGAEVFLLCRNEERGRAALRELREVTGNRRLRLVTVDVAEPDSIRAAVKALAADRVHVLVNNAAVLPAERHETSRGVELTFATNVLRPLRRGEARPRRPHRDGSGAPGGKRRDRQRDAPRLEDPKDRARLWRICERLTNT
jgi:NAD(P)-dependent dehydrogenase (short-subunit alcohol dehydrogenase family)